MCDRTVFCSSSGIAYWQSVQRGTTHPTLASATGLPEGKPLRPLDPSGKTDGNYLVAVDTVDAGYGETVLVVSGSSARMASGLKDCPVDAAIVGIVDTIDVKD